ncbi:hypothetical protein [Streptomyces paludis]|uniref:hypothetical protein n=1 Tax=Streptomyces paludis TaxID=2282738 RepID=UPI001E29D46F|nr:hypothetical protein [Streptomyces paludis]
MSRDHAEECLCPEHPVVGVFGSMAGVATVGMVLLMLTTSVAGVVFFARDPDPARGKVWQTRTARFRRRP